MKRHATNPGCVRERRAKAAIERRREKQEAKRQPLLDARTDHRAVLLRQESGPDLCALCWSVVRTWSDGSYPVHAEPRDPRPPSATLRP